MARAALQPADIAAFRTRAVVAATGLFARHGYDAVTMRAVAAELGCSAMTPYRYLAGKDELIALVRASAFGRFADHLEAAQVRRGPPLVRLRRCKASYIGFALAHADAYRIMFELRAPDDHDRWPALAREATRAFACVLDAVTAAIAAGALVGTPLTVARLLWASTHGLVSLHLAGRLSARALARLAPLEHDLAGFQPVPARRSRRSRS